MNWLRRKRRCKNGKSYLSSFGIHSHVGLHFDGKVKQSTETKSLFCLMIWGTKYRSSKTVTKKKREKDKGVSVLSWRGKTRVQSKCSQSFLSPYIRIETEAAITFDFTRQEICFKIIIFKIFCGLFENQLDDLNTCWIPTVPTLDDAVLSLEGPHASFNWLLWRCFLHPRCVFKDPMNGDRHNLVGASCDGSGG